MLMDSVVDERIRRVQRQLDEDREAVQLKSGVLRARELDLLLREQSLRRSTRLWTEPSKPVPLSAALAAAAAVQRGNSTGGVGRLGAGGGTSTGADFALYDDNNGTTNMEGGGYAAMAAAAAWIQRQPSSGFPGGTGTAFAASPRFGGGALLPPPGISERRSSCGTGGGTGGGNSPNQFSAYHRRFSSLANAAVAAGGGGAGAGVVAGGGTGSAEFPMSGWMNDYFANPSLFQRFSTSMMGSPGFIGDLNANNASTHSNNNNNRKSITFNSTVTQNQQQQHQQSNNNINNNNNTNNIVNHLFTSGGSNNFTNANGNNWMLMGGPAAPMAGAVDSVTPPQRLFHFIPNPCVEADDIPELVKDSMRRHALFCALDTNERGWLTREDMIALVLRSPGLHLHDDAEQTAAVIRSLERVIDKYAPKVSPATGMGVTSATGIQAAGATAGGSHDVSSQQQQQLHLNTSSNHSDNSLPVPPLPMSSAPDSPHPSADRRRPGTGSPYVPPISLPTADIPDGLEGIQGSLTQVTLSPHIRCSSASSLPKDPSHVAADQNQASSAGGTSEEEAGLPNIRHNSGGAGGMLISASSAGSGPLSSASPLSARITLPGTGGRVESPSISHTVPAAASGTSAQNTSGGSARRRGLHRKDEVMLNFDAFSEILLYLIRL